MRARSQIQATTLEWGTPFYTKVQTSAAVGEGPDIMTYHLSRVPLARRAGRPLAHHRRGHGGRGPLGRRLRGREPRTPPRWTARSTPCPSTSTPIVLYYNKDMLGEAGLLDEDGLPTGLELGVEGFTAALQTLKDAGVEYPALDPRPDGTPWPDLLLAARPAGRRAASTRTASSWPATTSTRPWPRSQVMADWVEASGFTPDQHRVPRLDRALHRRAGGDAHQRRLGSPDHDRPRRQGRAVRMGRGRRSRRSSTTRRPGPTATPSRSPPTRARDDPREARGRARGHRLDGQELDSSGRPPATSRPTGRSRQSAEYHGDAAERDLLRRSRPTRSSTRRSTLAGVASPVYDAAGNYMMPAVNGEMTAQEAVEAMRDDLQGQAY